MEMFDKDGNLIIPIKEPQLIDWWYDHKGVQYTLHGIDVEHYHLIYRPLTSKKAG